MVMARVEDSSFSYALQEHYSWPSCLQKDMEPKNQ